MSEKIFIEIEWETDGQEINLPVQLAVSFGEHENEDCLTEWLSETYGWLVKSWKQIEKPEEVIFFDEDGELDPIVLRNYLRKELDAHAGREPGNKEWTPGRWSGYTSSSVDKPDRFTMENENTGESIKVQVTLDQWEDNLCVLVTKKYIIKTTNTERDWHGHFGCMLPNARDEIATLIHHLAESHDHGTFSLYLAQQKNEVETLKAEVEELKQTIKAIRKRQRERENEEWY